MGCVKKRVPLGGLAGFVSLGSGWMQVLKSANIMGDQQGSRDDSAALSLPMPMRGPEQDLCQGGSHVSSRAAQPRLLPML